VPSSTVTNSWLRGRNCTSDESYGGFYLNGITLSGIAQFDDARFVLVAQRDVQRQINVAHQAHLAHGFLRR
jgi:hypothetical protein